MHRRRGGEARKRGINRRGVTPGIDQYPNLAAGFRRRALFFEKSPSAKSEHRQASPVISGSPLESFVRTQAPTSPGPWERAIEITMPTGLAVARGQFRLSEQGLTTSEQVPHGPFHFRRMNNSVSSGTTG